MASAVVRSVKPLLSTSWAVEKQHVGFYTGGKILLSKNEQFLVCLFGEEVKLVDVDSGQVIQTISQEAEGITCFALHPNDNELITGSRNLLLRHWDLSSKTCKRSWRAHEAPILDMCFDSTGVMLATSSSDRTVKVWDVEKGYCTHNFKGHEANVTRVLFHSDQHRWMLVSASDDCTVRAWDLITHECKVLRNHMSAVTDVSFSADGRNLISAGRDQVVCVWNLKDFSSTPVPTYETVEAVISIPSSMDTHGYPKNQKNRPELFVTAGDKGVLRIWNAALRTCVWEQKNKLTAVNIRNAADTSTTAHTITHLLLSPVRQKILAVTSDHYIFFLDPLNLTKTKQIAGFNDDVIDLKYIPTTDSIPRSSSSRIVLATNSERVQLLDLHSSDTQALSGHSDIVLSVDVSHDGRFVATAGKDNTIRVWSLYPINAESTNESTSESTAESKRTTEQEGGRCLAVVTGHTEAVSTVAFGRKSNGFLVSGSQDKTVKLWDMNWLNKTVGASETDQDILSITVASFTQRAHDKDINAVAVAPNDKLFASGSQDKTVKIWSVAEGKLLGTLKGHRRGVWTVEFSPVDKAVLTGSGDRTIRLWSLSDFSCIKTFEGHTNTVLKVAFLPMGMQLVSCGSDGLVKLWTIKTNECVATFEKHDDRIWALAVSTDGKQMITGGADSVVNIWKDITEEETEKQRLEEEEKILKEQQLMNLMRNKEHVKAIQLAFELDQPGRIRAMLENISEDEKDETERQFKLEEILKSISTENLPRLLQYIRDWNTSARNSLVAQPLLTAIFRCFSPAQLSKLDGVKDMFETLLPYSERHIQRFDKLIQKSYLLDFTLHSMKLLTPQLNQEDESQQQTASTVFNYFSITRKASLDFVGGDMEIEPAGESNHADSNGNGHQQEEEEEEEAEQSSENGPETTVVKPKKSKKNKTKSKDIIMEEEHSKEDLALSKQKKKRKTVETEPTPEIVMKSSKKSKTKHAK